MPAYTSISLGIRVACIAGILGAASLTGFAAVKPSHNEISANTTQLATGKKPHFINLPNPVFDSHPGPGNWKRLCVEGEDCSSADDDLKRRTTFKA